MSKLVLILSSLFITMGSYAHGQTYEGILFVKESQYVKQATDEMKIARSAMDAIKQGLFKNKGEISAEALNYLRSLDIKSYGGVFQRNDHYDSVEVEQILLTNYGKQSVYFKIDRSLNIVKITVAENGLIKRQ